MIPIYYVTVGMEHEIDVMETVLHIRNQRFGMVQTEVGSFGLISGVMGCGVDN